MIWGITIYFFSSLILIVSAFLNAGLVAGLCTFFTSLFAFIAASRVKSVLFWEDWSAKISQDRAIAGVLTSGIALALAYWLSTKFSVQFFGHNLSGTAWGCFGVVICFICADKKMAGVKSDPSPN